MSTFSQIELFNANLKVKGCSKRTISQYSCIVKKFLNQHKKSASNITADEIVVWISILKSSSAKRQAVGALRNFYTHVVGQPNKFKKVPYPKKEKKLPVIMSQEEVVYRINSIQNIKHKAIVSVLYATGVRREELLNLKVKDINKFRETIHVHLGKGAKDRPIPISKNLLALLRMYYREYRPKEFLFEGQNGGKYSGTSVVNICNKHMNTNPHSLRHACLTHLIEKGVHISEVAKRAGHSDISVTHNTYSHIATTFNPITLLAA